MANTPADKPLITADLTTHPALKTSGIEQLKPPGPDSNYLDWSWILDIHFNSCGVSYILDPEEKVAELGKARTSYSQDNLAICAVIAKTIHPANIRYVRQYKRDARGLWNALKSAHQDNSSGGVMYWLRKLTLSRMTGDDITSHLDEMAKVFERLNSLISSESPLTAEDIYLASILISLPTDWLSCVSSMMNEPRVSPARIINALKQEDLRRKTRIEESPTNEATSKVSAQPSSYKN